MADLISPTTLSPTLLRPVPTTDMSKTQPTPTDPEAVERIRTRGGIHHEWLRPYIEKNANRYQIWGGRPRGQGMPAFPKGRAAPAFPAIKSATGALPPTSTRWCCRAVGQAAIRRAACACPPCG